MKRTLVVRGCRVDLESLRQDPVSFFYGVADGNPRRVEVEFGEIEEEEDDRLLGITLHPGEVCVGESGALVMETPQDVDRLITDLTRAKERAFSATLQQEPSGETLEQLLS